MARLFFLLTITLFFLSTAATAEVNPEDDPYASIEMLTLPNGLKVILAPGEETKVVQVRLEVDVGTEAEDATNIGVAHLLEHVLFRDKKQKDEMTYLQLIQEAGGKANGTTEDRTTSFFASIPAKKGLWLVGQISRMIIHPSITSEFVEKEKNTVELERGRPGLPSQMLGFDVQAFLYPKYLNPPDFWETEFKVKFKDAYSLTEEQLSTQRLTQKQVQTLYQDYYYPANMRLFITGKYEREKLLMQIQHDWEKFPARAGKLLNKTPTPISNGHRYRQAVVSTGTPYISIGTKFTNADQKTSLVLNSYMDYLAHRIMKTLRNLKGQTYTAKGDFENYKGCGYALIGFQTAPESFKDNLRLARDLINKEARLGGLSNDDIEEAKNLFLSKYHLMGREASDLMKLAKEFWSINNEYGVFNSPYAVLQGLSSEEYRILLQAAYTQNLDYESIASPPYIFRYDQYFLFIFTAILTFRAFRARLKKPFNNSDIRWVRKVVFPPLKFLEFGILTLGWFVIAHLLYPYNLLFRQFSWLNSSILISSYLYGVGYVVIIILAAQGLISLVPRKVMITKSHLLIKSISYFSKQIPLSEIKRISTLSLYQYFANWSLIQKIGLRNFYYNFQFWEKGILIELNDGRAYLFGLTDPDRACAELNDLLQIEKSKPMKSIDPSRDAA